MDHGHKKGAENVDQEKVYKLRSSMKKSFRIRSDSRDDSMEGCDDTLAGPPRRVSFAASNTIKPFVNDPEKITIWDNTYEELVDHTDSNSAVSVGCSVRTIDSIKQSINIQSTSSHETNDKCLTYQSMEVHEIKRKDLFLTTVETADMELTCQLELPQNNVLKTNRTVKASSVNHTMYPNTDMSLTCVFPLRDMNLENTGPNGNKSLTCDDPNVDMNPEDKLIRRTEHPSINMSLTCAFPNQDVNLNKDPNTKINLDNVAVNRDVNFENNFNRRTEDSNADMSLTFPIRDMNPESKSLIGNKSLTCDDPDVDMSLEDSLIRRTEHSSINMSLTCAFPNQDVNLNKNPNTKINLDNVAANRDVNFKDTFNRRTEDPTADMSLTCVFPIRDMNLENKGPNGNKSLTCNDPNVDMNPEDDLIRRTEHPNINMSLTCAFPNQDVSLTKDPNTKINLDNVAANRDVNSKGTFNRRTEDPNADMSLTFPNRDMNLENKSSNGNKSLTCDDPDIDISPEDNLIRRTEHPSINMSLTCAFPSQDVSLNKDPNTKINLDNVAANRDMNSKDTFNCRAEDPNADMSLTCGGPNRQVDPENNVYYKTAHTTADMSLTGAFPVRDLKPDINIYPGAESESYVGTQRHTLSSTGKIHYSAAMEVTGVFPQEPELPKLNSPKIDSAETFSHADKQVHKTVNNTNINDCVAPDPVATEMFSILADENDPIENEKCILVDLTSSIIEEGECHSFNLVNVRTQGTGPGLSGFKKSASLLHFSDGCSSTQKHSNFSNTSIYNTQQLLEAKSFDIKDISGLKPIDKSTEIISLDKKFEPLVESSFQTNRILNNIEAKLIPNRCRSSTAFDTQDYKDLIKDSQNLCLTISKYLGDYSPTKRSVSVLETEIKRLSLACSSASSNSSVLSSNTEVDLQDEEVENVCSAVTSKHQKIMDVFMNTKADLLKLLSFEENNYTFSTYFSAVRISVNVHADDGRVVDIGGKSLLNPNPQNSLLFVQNAFLVQHILNKLQMCNLKSSLGQNFDMLSLLDHIQIITDKCFDFVYEFVKIQRQFKTLEMNKNGTVSFNILHTNPPIFWTVEFQLASPETIQQNSLKVSSKWSSINQDHFETILRNTEPGVDCIQRFATKVLEYFNRIELRKIKVS